MTIAATFTPPHHKTPYVRFSVSPTGVLYVQRYQQGEWEYVAVLTNVEIPALLDAIAEATRQTDQRGKVSVREAEQAAYERGRKRGRAEVEAIAEGSK